jgi:invasion protein IalB
MGQAIFGKDAGERLMTVLVLKSTDAAPVLRVTVPLGVNLENGLPLSVDGDAPVALVYVLCLKDGCLAQHELGPDLLDRMKKGTIANVTVTPLGGQPVTVPVSLSGFTAALGDL